MRRSLLLLVGAGIVLSAQPGAADLDYARSGFYLGLTGNHAQDLFDEEIQDEMNAAASASAANIGDPFVVQPPIELKIKGSWGASVLAGYRFHPRLSAEAQLEWLGGFDGNWRLLDSDETPPPDNEETIENGSASVESMSLTANLKAHLMTGPFQPFLRVGAGVMKTKSNIEGAMELEEPECPPGSGDTCTRNTIEVFISESSKSTDFAMRFGGGFDIYAFEGDRVVITFGADYVTPFSSGIDFDYISVGIGFLYRFSAGAAE